MLNFFKFNQSAFGLDISDFSIELLELERSGLNPRLKSEGRYLLEKGIVEDGKILIREKLIGALNGILEHAFPKPPDTNRVIISFPESRTFIHTLELPTALTPKEEKEFIRQQVGSLVPIPEEALVWTTKRIGSSREPRTVDVLLAATTRELIVSYTSLITGCGLDLVAVDLESASLSRVVGRLKKDGPILIMDIGARTTNLTIEEEGVVRFSAVIPFGGYHLTHALSQELKISFERAEVLKRDVGFDPEREGGRVMMVLQQVMQRVIGETQHAIRFYKERKEKEVKQLILAGGGSLMPNLVSYIALNLDIPATLLDPWQGIGEGPFSPSSKEAHPIFFANAMGLALRGIEPHPESAGINLLQGLH